MTPLNDPRNELSNDPTNDPFGHCPWLTCCFQCLLFVENTVMGVLVVFSASCSWRTLWWGCCRNTSKSRGSSSRKGGLTEVGPSHHRRKSICGNGCGECLRPKKGSGGGGRGDDIRFYKIFQKTDWSRENFDPWHASPLIKGMKIKMPLIKKFL